VIQIERAWRGAHPADERLPPFSELDEQSDRPPWIRRNTRG